ncbi:twin-arginine translocation signal domain-containing protein [Streptomyces sp. TRM68416]|uniref:twin-arginine translocation signal domain-containing protein n=1 Tax=Streptomyces sp. TRM68416 TaxID=2758412 RepID=UPI001661F984|nr:twin-arginine translocation signal domain-containing protein [Streptomyces sp. TRM68416]MBD0842092.1 twin-arginine translocation signal domain-containing protein [Streptomyces sp. TRM68416]
MSSISRRSLIGYSGTTAAGAVLGSAASAQPAQAAEAQTEAEAASAVFPPDTLFSGMSRISHTDTGTELYVKFSVEVAETPPAGAGITPQEIAELLSDFAVSRGWPPITFYGRPAPTALN